MGSANYQQLAITSNNLSILLSYKRHKTVSLLDIRYKKNSKLKIHNAINYRTTIILMFKMTCFGKYHCHFILVTIIN